MADPCDLTETLLAIADESADIGSSSSDSALRSLERLRRHTGAVAAVLWLVTDGTARRVLLVGDSAGVPATVRFEPASMALERLRRKGAIRCSAGEISGVEQLVPPGLQSSVAAAATRQGTVAAVLALGWVDDAPPCSERRISDLRVAASLLVRAFTTPPEHAQQSTPHGAIADSLVDRIAVLDSEGTIIAVNASWQTLTQRDTVASESTVGIGVNYLEVCRRSAAGGSSDAARALAGLAAVCSGTTQSFELVYSLCSSRGEMRWWLLRAVPLRRRGGGAVVGHIEITGSTTTELARVIDTGHFANIADSLLVPVFTSDETGVLLFGNAQWLEVTGRRVTVGAPWTNACHPADREAAGAAMRAAAANRTDFAAEVRLLQADGAYRWWKVTGAPHYGPEGALRSYVASCWDVTQARHTQQALHDAGARLIASQEAVRSRIARELHDDLGQQVVLLATRLDTLMAQGTLGTRQLRAAIEETQRGLQELARGVHNLSHELHPARLRLLGLERTIAGLGRDISAGSGVEVRFAADGAIGELQDDCALCIFRIAQEALQNAVKHGGATLVHVSLAGTATHISLRVTDDGVGFDSLALSTGLGLLTMRERVELLGGTLRIHTAPSSGTTIEATVPIAAESPESSLAGLARP